MTKKDYILLAQAVQTERSQPGFYGKVSEHVHTETLNRLAIQLACRLEEDNPRFDRDRFLSACGVQS